MSAAIPSDQITGIVLAGGRGSRMGGLDKGLQNHKGVPLALHALLRLQPQVGPLMINANRNLSAYESMGVPVWPDVQADYPGPLAGVLVGLERCETPYLVTVPCDTPMVGTPAARAEPYDASGLPELRSAFAGPRVESELKTDAWGPSLSGYAPIRDASGRAVAVLGVDVDATSLARVDERALALTLPIHALALVVLAIAGVVLGRGVRKPIERMIEATRRIAAGDLSARVELARKDELGLLGRYFDRMAAQLEERERLQALFGRYVSEDVARRVLASPEEADKLGGEEREVTILFADLRRFSESLAERPAAEVIGELEGYLDAMTALVEEHGGCVLE
ncbi:MAG: NTP transferase domain-containing protein, partial [Sandaracinaceae bacterium]|nr:NTP transferase domain-containing protein [Sandaracinaceae bacterium]